MKRGILIVFLVLFILFTVGAMGYAAYRYLLMPNETVVPAFSEGELNLVIEGVYADSGHGARIEDGEILLPVDLVKKYFDPYIYWDDELKKITVTTKDRVIRMKTDKLEALVNNEPVRLNIPAFEQDNLVYIPIEFLSDFYNIEISYLEDNNVIIIDYKNRMKQTAEPISDKAVIRTGRSIKHPVLKKLNNEEEDRTLRVFEEYDKWLKVRTSEGIIGFIEKKFVVVRWVTDNSVPFEQAESDRAWRPDKGKINLVWDMMYSGRPDLASIGKMNGLDVISPTWFQIINENGKVLNRADARYVEWAHSNGYKVWALLSNDFGNPELTHKILNNTDARDNIIKETLAYAALYKLDGINIDFENINLEDRDALTQFVREITPFFKEQGMVVSMDVGVPDGSNNYSRCYDFKALGEAVDYIAVMTYDQHWSTSPKAGSVAQLSWVEAKVKRILEMVPAEKLLLGLPFYIRLWVERPDENGNIVVSNPSALSMGGARRIIQENNANVVWDEESGQFYTEFEKEGSMYKMWLEDENSINLKSSLVHKYKLAGTAAWARGNEEQQVWKVLEKNLKEIDTYHSWKKENSSIVAYKYEYNN
ncbi:MAG: glycosyl hydrolase family 18 protein [Acetivibrionales bacterium]